MGFKWRDSLSGAMNGAKAGSFGGPIGTVVGAVAGGALGGFGKDIDKGISGDSQSGLVSRGLGMAGQFGGGMGGGASADSLPSGAGITMPGDSGYSMFGEGQPDDYSQIFELFQQFQNRNKADSSSPFYDQSEHAELIRSRYPFIPQVAFQNWLKDNPSPTGYQIAG